ncbi:peptide/nickel transport system ATP-binding protein/dipeptide transport system ATP-binding protein [Persephonella hydrogeniphila]|uniref:Peptide/nickel transport system ATP-binding protein/dipeptide transport system ATP-binding protein n=1 Tax=Persephonella hydrogeniphila TaxID=198703 RepID=A0A285N1P7_9AQUI|nr:ABC transporter ATP-binding protein [Persephonella hydrogeniphila]SNZ03369.1 peptide/nickel transport system ATP-binding protein/dipeptide transport system ATP-binding protein [Persephonella hydrogeniphila]
MIEKKKDGSTVLSVKDLRVSFNIENQTVEALKGISFDIYRKEIVALVGESGSGKSVTCYSILKLLPVYASVSGQITLWHPEKIENLLSLPEQSIRKIRGRHISMIFQEPSAVLDPLMRVGDQIVETVMAHRKVSYSEAKKIAMEAMEKARIPEVERRFYQYPHELSGGLKQRVVIASGIVNNPIILLADEPTTALDVTVSAQILKLFKSLRDNTDVSILLITHDLGVVAEIADRVLVIYRGEIVEEGDVFSIFDSPEHPYTKKLLSSRPVLKDVI